MAKEKLKSGYLDCDVEVDFQQTEVNGIPTTIITHDSLEDVIFNQIPNLMKTKVRCKKIVEHVSSGHAVVQCILSDETGREIPSIGESLTKTLYTDIAKGIPVTMAEIRAFDRAAIRYLNLPGKVYSNEEGVRVDGSENNAYDAATIVDPNEFADITVLPSESAVTNEPESPKTIVSETVSTENPATATEQKSAKEANNLKVAGAMKITFGKFEKNPQTVAEICNNPKEQRWVEYVLGMKSDGDKEKKRQIKCIRYYFEHMKGSGNGTDVA